VEEFVACGVWPPAVGVSFDQVSIRVTPISKLNIPLPNFVASRKDDEDEIKFLAMVELDTKVIVGSYTHPKHDACNVGLHNEGHLNYVLELAEVAYGARSMSGSDAFCNTHILQE
jgi:hypothetical protein